MSAPAIALGVRARYTRSEAPLLWAALALASGIVLARFVWRPTWMWLAAFALFAFAAAYFASRRQRIAIASVLLTLAALGGVTFSARASQPLGPNLIVLDGHEVTVIAHVTRDNAQHQRGNETSQVIDLESESVQLESSAPQPLRFGIGATMYSREQFSADDA